MDGADFRESYCPLFHQTIELIGRRWTGTVLLALAADLRYFSDIRDSVPGLSDRLLVERLRELEDEEIVARESQGRAVAYSLTSKGQALVPALDAVYAFAETWCTADQVQSETA